MCNLEKVFSYEKQSVRTLIENEAIWFVAKDVCKVLDIKDARQAVGRLEEDERCLITVTDSLGRKQDTFVVNEFGLYSLILGSRKPEARNFKRCCLRFGCLAGMGRRWSQWTSLLIQSGVATRCDN